jgi:cell division protein FtsI/penicillin-binding protein 2
MAANSNFSLRIRILSIGIFIFASLLMVKLFFIQVIHGEEFDERADHQYATPADIFERGTIHFQKKNGTLVSAATIVSGFKLVINPKEITDPEKTLSALSDIVLLDRDQFIAKAEKKNDPYEEIAEHLTKEQADKISEMDLEGVHLYREKWRFYPGGELAAQTIGFLAFDEDTLAGRYGLERQYEDILSRHNNNLYINFFAEIFANLKDNILGKKDKEGDVTLTIEPVVQGFLEKSLSGVISKFSSDFAGGIIIDPKTGEIYAMGSLPSFDLNNFSKVDNPAIYSNKLVENVFEFGSVVKTLTMAAGLDAGAVTADTTYDDKGFLVLNNSRINNFDKKARGVVSMQEVLNQSLNTGVSFVFSRLGRDKFRDYFYSFGIGEKTGVDLPNEARGLVENLKSRRDIEYATASFGQGIAMTAMEAVRAFSILGNGGYLITPHVVKEVNYIEGGIKKISYNQGRQVIGPQTSEEITRMLVTVVDKALLGGTVKMDHYSIAAKTGTAQIAREDAKGYYDDRYLHSFMGYFPAYDPKFLVFLYTVNPKGVSFASHTLTYPFMDIAKFLLNYYEIPPDR